MVVSLKPRETFKIMTFQYSSLFTVYSYRAANYMAQIADALMYLHAKKVAHRYLKPENMLIGFHGEIKICDFGCAIEILAENR